MRCCEAREDARVCGNVDVEGNGRNVGVAHERLANRVNAMVPVPEHVGAAVYGAVVEFRVF